jgi:hypothetical protein
MGVLESVLNDTRWEGVSFTLALSITLFPDLTQIPFIITLTAR